MFYFKISLISKWKCITSHKIITLPWNGARLVKLVGVLPCSQETEAGPYRKLDDPF